MSLVVASKLLKICCWIHCSFFSFLLSPIRESLGGGGVCGLVPWFLRCGCVVTFVIKRRIKPENILTRVVLLSAMQDFALLRCFGSCTREIACCYSESLCLDVKVFILKSEKEGFVILLLWSKFWLVEILVAFGRKDECIWWTQELQSASSCRSLWSFAW